MQILSDMPRPIIRYAVGLWTRRWLILAIAWIVAAAVWVGTSMLPNYYESRAQIYVDTDTALNETLEESARRADIEKRVRVMTLQLLSRENLEQVIYNAGIDGELKDKARQAAPAGSAEYDRTLDVLMERKIEDLRDNINVSSQEEQYFNITYRAQDPVLAQRVVASVVNLLIEKDVGAAMAQSETALDRLDREISRYERMLSQKDQEIADFRSLNANELAGNEQTRRRLDQKETELNTTEFNLEQAQRRRQTLLSELAVTSATTSGTELDQLRMELAELQSQFRDNYPDIIALKARIAELERGGEGLPTNPEYQRLQSAIRLVDGEISVLRQRQQRLRDEIDELTLSASQMPAVQAQLQEIMRNYDQIESSYEDLLAERERQSITASLTEGGGTVEYNIYEAPKVAAEPVAPKRGLMTIGGLIAGLAAGIGIAFLMSQVDRTYIQGSDVEDALGLPVLGAISPSQTAYSRRAHFRERSILAAAFGVLFVVAVGLYWMQEVRVDKSAKTTTTVALRSEGL